MPFDKLSYRRQDTDYTRGFRYIFNLLSVDPDRRREVLAHLLQTASLSLPGWQGQVDAALMFA